MGYFYSRGIVVPKDEKQSVFWYRKAAEQGNVKAQAKSGTAYMEGRGGLSVDLSRAKELLTKAAAQDDPDAQGSLGFMYETGQGAPRDYSKALELYRKAADQKSAYAEFRLGIMYQLGRGVPLDYAIAAQWYRKASDEGYIAARTPLNKPRSCACLSI
ncbi:sel1 repeat family protein [Bradyrhizobium diazoefficiens]|nr:sel1 repeat family protein [Bradyrhizobium diazoefficiens]